MNYDYKSDLKNKHPSSFLAWVYVMVFVLVGVKELGSF